MGRGYSYYVMKNDSEIPNTLLGGGMGRERNLIKDPNITDRTTRTHRKTPINDEDIRVLTPRIFENSGFSGDFKLNVSKSTDISCWKSVAIDVCTTRLEMMKKLVEKNAINGYSVRPADSTKYEYDLNRIN